MLKLIHLSNCITIRREENPNFNPAELIQNLTHPNPKYFENQRLGFSVFGIPRDICLAELYDDRLTLPRGTVADILKSYPNAEIIDKSIVNPASFSQSKIILKDFQQAALDSLLQKNQGILVSPPGSGKTIVGIELIIHRRNRTIILCHTKDLCQQWEDRFRQFTNLQVGAIQGDRYEIKDITIATIQSLNRPLDDTLTGQFGTVILDECHHAPAATFQQIVDQFPARYRYGVTATPERQDGLQFIMTAVLGPILHRVESAVLIGNGSILRPKIKVIHTNSHYSAVESYQELLARIVKDECRNKLIVDLIGQEARNGHFCIALSERVSHARELHRLFQEHNRGIAASCITGQDSKETRQAAIDAMNAGTGNVLFATRIADEGMDIRRLDRLFLTSPCRATNKVTQQIGRIQRTFSCKKDAIVFDFLDLNSLAESQYYSRLRNVYSDYEIENIRDIINGTNTNHEKAA